MRNQRIPVFAVMVLALAYFLGLLMYSRVRRLDFDEGFYTTAARLVAEGKTPYRDFFYPQAPLLPYIYAIVWSAGGRTLESMRDLSAACGAAAVLVWGLFLVSVLRLPWRIAFATFACLLLNPYWISWNVTVKTYALSNLLISVALVSLYVALSREQLRWFFVAGLALGTTTSVRSLYGPLIPLVLIWMLIRLCRSGKSRPSQIAVLAAGAAVGLAPMAYSFFRDPQAFLFNNVGYHVLWLVAPGLIDRLVEAGAFAILFLAFRYYWILQMILFGIGA
ncbi:MAG: ArnT family glycosyltransferase, partial [Terriglobales bacterium]